MHQLFFLKGLHQIASGEICTKIIRFDANIIKAVKTAMHALKKGNYQGQLYDRFDETLEIMEQNKRAESCSVFDCKKN